MLKRLRAAWAAFRTSPSNADNIIPDATSSKDGVSLQQFVSNTLSELLLGIADAKAGIRNSRNPSVSEQQVGPPIEYVGQGFSVHESDVIVTGPGDKPMKGHLVKFDVAVHATAKRGASGGVQVAAAPIGGVEAKYGRTAEESRISRIQFSIPMILAIPSERVTEQRVEEFRRHNDLTKSKDELEIAKKKKLRELGETPDGG